jgi:hypothetical protein
MLRRFDWTSRSELASDDRLERQFHRQVEMVRRNPLHAADDRALIALESVRDVIVSQLTHNSDERILASLFVSSLCWDARLSDRPCWCR